MWEVLRKETTVQSGRTALRTDVADAMKRLWARGEHGRIPAWAPGSVINRARGRLPDAKV
jgi:hypothetical protein